ncbi:hypothetical protein BO221_30545 [Archangium sp. Cb G35]|uniref:oxygenase MpaB family protein n=1 Tax=Archangium sp. Cb G35 TaxID=1920190 RepID=UPI00093749EF|nr:oxygenase MpaB family protein [Archangium sp. Cb G35]OJT20668.1 hypothetical protein BO221_30545 [Archangium sp. Cb G35]
MSARDLDVGFSGRLVNFEAARARHGEKADFMARMLAVGDPLADAVIAELDSLGQAGRQLLNAGLTDGLDSLKDPPPAIAALLRQLETVPEWVDREALVQGDVVSQSIPPLWSNLAFSAGSLVHTYSSPAIARLLVQTGQLSTMARRRLLETGIWRIQSILPGGLVRGAPGYVQTVQVRLLHARMRATALKRGWEHERWGVPINQTDVARTWLDFTIVPFRALAQVGLAITEEQQESLYRHWWYVGHLLGLDEGFFLPLHNHDEAEALLELVDSTTTPLDENTRILTMALLDANVDELCAVPGSPFTRPVARELLNALTRLFQGDEVADALGVPPSPVMSLLPLFAGGNAETRRWQVRTPDAAEQARAENLAVYREWTSLAPDGTEYQKHIRAAG